MALTCRNLLGLTAFNHIQLVAGEKGLEKPITWPYAKQTDSLQGWINGGEILFIVEKSSEKEESYFVNLMDECARLKVSAIIFFCQGEDYIEHVPECVKILAEKYAIPVFEMPSDIRMIDVTREISNTIFLWNYQNKQAENFLMELIHQDYLSGNQRASDGSYYGFDLDKESFIAVFCDKKAIDCDANDLFTLQSRFSLISMSITMACEQYGEKQISTFSCGTMICYFSSENKERRTLLINRINQILEGQNRNNMRKDELLSYCDEVLHKLKEVDQKENSEYVRTMWLYLKMNNNLVKTAQAMYIHRNTLVNRINKIQAIIGKDINDVKVKMEYLNVFSILEFYGMIGE